MKLASFFATVILSCGFIGTVNATVKTTELGALQDGDFGFIANGFGSAGSFADVITFSLGSTSNISGWSNSFRLMPDVTYVLRSLTANLDVAMGAFSSGSYSFEDLAPGNYSLGISGSNRLFGGYAAFYSVAAVPEPETWLMIVIGMGLVAFQLQRKQKSLRQQSLLPA
ncbi:MAG: FxDxF family PEP-CTERM protein [Steroidobacteraceae bacterium]